MGTIGSLRGRTAFAQLFESGQRCESALVRCLWSFEKDATETMLVGYAVSSRLYNAVRRNRVKRLMRAAFAGEAGALASALAGSGSSVRLLFVFKGGKGVDVDRLKLLRVQKDIVGLSRTVAARV